MSDRERTTEWRNVRMGETVYVPEWQATGKKVDVHTLKSAKGDIYWVGNEDRVERRKGGK